jgi:YidC/Oxa1 family membrane protein insertase
MDGHHSHHLSKVNLCLGTKSYKSMNQMKNQLLIQERKVQERPEKMNEEVSGCIVPTASTLGCLPMVEQISVFFAFTDARPGRAAARAPFGWINDLSARTARSGWLIPFMEPPYGIPVLTLVMGATMLLQQKMTPSTGDPTQAKMMMLMPVVFTFIFINFSSGLVLYWLVNNVLSIGQQYYTQKKFG